MSGNNSVKYHMISTYNRDIGNNYYKLLRFTCLKRVLINSDYFLVLVLKTVEPGLLN